jgi:hypothetical protein
MKKISGDVIAHLLFGVAAIGLLIGGAIMLIASFFTALPIFNAFIVLTLGAILYVGVRLYFVFGDVLESITKLIEISSSPQINKNGRIYKNGLLTKQMGFGDLPTHDLSKIPHPAPGLIDEILIDENTTPEEIENIKKKYPGFSHAIDEILEKVGGISRTSTLPLSSLSSFKLEKLLQEAIDKNDFERAAEIRDEINRRNK